MKIVWSGLKWVGGLVLGVVGTYIAFEGWVVSKAITVVEPVKTHVETLDYRQREHHERVERELLMIRSQNDRIFDVIVKKNI